MPLIVVEMFCNRCRRWVEGYDLGGATSGFVRVDVGRWAPYRREGETILCGECLETDPKYRADYPYAAQQMHLNGL